jgi:hypothetical protein
VPYAIRQKFSPVILLPSPPPRALRLACVRPVGRPPRPPFGLSAWTEASDACIGVLLDLPDAWPTSGFGEADVVARQLPDPTSLSAGQLVVVLPRGAPAGEWLSRLLGKRAWAAGAIRATALLARGYRRIGAGFDPVSHYDLVWGYAP